MPEYLVSGCSPEGRQVVERVEATTAGEAVKLLEGRGITEVVLHTDDLAHFVARNSLQQNNISVDDARRSITARESLAMQRDSTSLGRLLLLIRKSLVANWTLFVAPWIVVAIWYSKDRGLQFSDYVLLIGPVAFYLLWLPLRLTLWGPGAAYRRLIHACAWGRWEEVLRVLPKVQGKVSPHEVAFRKGDALSALGNLQAGLDVVKPFGDCKQIPLWLYQVRLASLYASSHDFESSVACCQKAAELAPDQPVMWLDYAQALIRRRRDPQAARAALDQAKKNPIPDLIAYGFDQCQGAIALEERRHQEALEHLTRAMEKLERYSKANALIGAAKDRLRAYLCLAHAACGNSDEACRFYKLAQPRLRALKYDDLIERCESALKNC